MVECPVSKLRVLDGLTSKVYGGCLDFFLAHHIILELVSIKSLQINLYLTNVYCLIWIAGIVAIGCDYAFARDFASPVHAGLGPKTSPVLSHSLP